jgi:hypothetical protein
MKYNYIITSHLDDTFILDDGNLRFYIKSEFLKICPDIQDTKISTMVKKYTIGKYLHRTNGFAIETLDSKSGMNFINGKRTE